MSAPLLAQLHQPVLVPASPDEQLLPKSYNTSSRRTSNTTLRLPARASTYNWVPAAGQWATQAVITTSSYNAQGALILATSIDSVTQQPQVRKAYTRDPNGVTSLYLEEEWTGSAWQNRIQWVNTLDSQGQLLGQIRQQWTNGAWVNTGRYEQQIDSHGNQTLYRNYEWINGSWALLTGLRSDITYDALDRVQQVVFYDIDPSGGQMLFARDTYTYTVATNVRASISSEDFRYGVWTNTYRDVYTYNTQGWLAGWQSYSWSGSAWQLASRVTRTFDSATDSYVESKEKLTGTVWTNDTRVSYSYDAFGNYLGYTRDQWRTTTWQLAAAGINFARYNTANDIVSKLYKTASGNPLALTNNSKTYYSNFQSYILATRPALKAAANWQPYPNPSTGRVTLTPAAGQAGHLRAAEVLNSLGQVVRQQRFGQAVGVLPVLEMSGLPAGIYTLRLQTDAGTELHRLQKQ